MIPPYKFEQSGNTLLDRIQREVARAIDAVNVLSDRTPRTYVRALKSDFTNTEARLKPSNLAFPGRKGETWLVEWKGNAGCSGSTGGMKFGLLAPTGSVVTGAIDSSLANATDDAHVQVTSVNTATSAVHTVNGGTRDDEGYFVIALASDGTVALGIQPTTATDTATLSARAWLRATLVEAV